MLSFFFWSAISQKGGEGGRRATTNAPHVWMMEKSCQFPQFRCRHDDVLYFDAIIHKKNPKKSAWYQAPDSFVSFLSPQRITFRYIYIYIYIYI